MPSQPTGAEDTFTPEMKVLIVDDTPSAVQLLIDTLSSEPYELLTATSGDACVDIAARERPDVILLDVMLPGMSGFDVCQRPRQTPALADIVVLTLTALDDRRARLSAYAAGADDFLAKPFDRVELRLRLRGIARLNRFRRLWEAQRVSPGPASRSAQDAVDVLHDARLAVARAEQEHGDASRHLAVAAAAIERVTTLLQRPADADAAALSQGQA